VEEGEARERIRRSLLAEEAARAASEAEAEGWSGSP
jgi:hypothetical protein